MENVERKCARTFLEPFAARAGERAAWELHCIDGAQTLGLGPSLVEFQISTHTQSCSCTFILSGWPQRPLCIVTIHLDHQLEERDGLRVHAHEPASGYLLTLLGRLGV